MGALWRLTDGDKWRLAFGQALERLRKERGLSKERMARDLGLSRGHASRLESGRTAPILPTMAILASFLKLSFPDFAREINNEYMKLSRKRRSRDR